MPIVSVLLPVYNAKHELPRALKSLQAQTFHDFEIIAINDGSTDGSGEILDEHARLDPRLHVFHQANAGALGKVLNRAAELATGKYLARHDADDASTPTRLESQVNYLDDRHQTSLCGTWTWYIDAELGPLYSLELPDKHSILAHFLSIGKNPLVHGSIMMRAEVFQKLNGYRGSYSEDYDLWLRMSEITRMGICPSLGYYYWRSVTGISTGADLRQRALVKLILKLGAERKQFGREISDWETEYQKIVSLPLTESDPVERQTALRYARGLQFLHQGKFDASWSELKRAASGQGQYALKARRNLSIFWLAPLLAKLYAFQQNREPERFARRFPDGTEHSQFGWQPMAMIKPFSWTEIIKFGAENVYYMAR